MYIVKLSQAISPENLPDVAKAAATLFRTEPGRMEGLLAQEGTQLTKPLEHDKAERMAGMLEQIGLTVDIVELPSEAQEIPATQMDTPVSDPVAKPNYLKYWPDALLVFAFLALTSGIAMTAITGRSFSFIAKNVAPVNAASSTANPSANNSVSNQVLAEAAAPTAVEAVTTAEPEVLEEANEEAVTEAVTDVNVAVDPSVLVVPLDSDDAITQESSLLETASSDEVAVAEEATVEERIVAVIPEDVPAVVEESPADAMVEAASPESMTEEVVAEVTETSESMVEAAPTTDFVVKNLSELNTGKYLQAGAYKTTETALNQKAALERLGFAVTPAQDHNFVVILVGPFSDADLSSAASTLSSKAVSYYQRNLP